MNTTRIKECRKCINNSQNPSVKIDSGGYCQVCRAYQKNFDLNKLANERKLFQRLAKNQPGQYDVMVGLSGGKDSSATLWQLKKIGLRILAFTFDPGYLPDYIFQRARYVAEKLCQVDYQVIPIKNYFNQQDRQNFHQLLKLYQHPNRQDFLKQYQLGRENYQGIIRPCWICRRAFIRAYYQEAVKRRIKLVVLAINEWVSLRSTAGKNNFKISAIRKLKPFKDRPAVYIVHYPFLIQANLNDTKKILKQMKWKYYRHIQSNAFSCRLASAAEKILFKNLGFHPDTTRLAREVAAGFLTKNQAKQALSRVKKSPDSVEQVLKGAKI